MFILATSINMDFSSMTKYMPMFMEGILMTLALSLATVILGTLIVFIMSLLKRYQFNFF